MNEEGGHWTLAVIDMEFKTIKYYDSFNGSEKDFVLTLLQTFLTKNYDTECQWEGEYVEGTPKQKNGYDCGVFVCQYAKYISSSQPMSFTQDDMVDIRQKMVVELCENKLFD